MIPVSFEYQNVKTIDEALAALSANDSKLLAGGHSLLPAMKLRLSMPVKLVDISGIAELKGIVEKDGEIVIGAGTTHAEILNHDLIKNKLSFFSEGASMIGDIQVRNHGTIGGSLAHADPAADWGALVLAADAILNVQGSKAKRQIKATDFFKGIFTTALTEDEIIVSIRVPVPAKGSRTSYQKFSQPASRFAIAACAVLGVPGEKINIAFTGVTDAPFRDKGAEAVLKGKDLNEAAIKSAQDAALSGVQALSDHFASADYRLHMARVCLKKALQAVK